MLTSKIDNHDVAHKKRLKIGEESGNKRMIRSFVKHWGYLPTGDEYMRLSSAYQS